MTSIFWVFALILCDWSSPARKIKRLQETMIRKKYELNEIFNSSPSLLFFCELSIVMDQDLVKGRI